MHALHNSRSLVVIALTVLALVAVTPAQDRLPAWEYLEVVWTHDTEEGRTSITYEIRQSGEPVEVVQAPLEPAIDMLNRMGAKGWELILAHESTSIWPRTTTYVFKRPTERP